MLSKKENYYRLLEGKMPEYVPVFDMMPYPGIEPTAVMTNPGFLDFHGPKGGVDPWGVKFITNPETGYSAIPQNWEFMMDDITKWRDIIKNPDLDEIDWKTWAEKDAEFMKNVMGIDREKTLVLGVTSAGFFQDLVGFMGFVEGICAMVEEPEECHALFEYMSEYYLKLQHYIIDYYSPDAIYLLDDTAAKRTPFVSRDIFEELLLPFYKILIEDAKDHGLPVQFHNCGHCDEFMIELAEAGVTAWDPVQETNDILAVKEKLGKKLALCGCWDWRPPSTYPEVDEADIRRQVRETIDKYAPGGGFAMCGGANVIGKVGDDMPNIIRGWVLDEAYTYGETFYKNHPEAVY